MLSDSPGALTTYDCRPLPDAGRRGSAESAPNDVALASEGVVPDAPAFGHRLMVDHDEIVRIAQGLEPLPSNCARLATLAAQDVPDIPEVIDIFRQDPVLTAKLLRLANSAAYGAPRTVGTVKEAVLRLGTTAVFGLAVGIASRPKLENHIPAYKLGAGALWDHSLTAAMATGVLTIHLGGRMPPLAFTAALLHDMGKLVLGRLLTSDLQHDCQRAVSEGGLQPFEAESEILTVHHGEVAGIIMQLWQLPQGIVNGVTFHHDPQATDDPHAVITYLANVVAKMIGGKPIGTPAELSTLATALERIELAEEELQSIERATAARMTELGPIYR